MALLGAAIMLCSLAAAAFCVYELIIYFFFWFETGELMDEGLHPIKLAVALVISFVPIYFGCLLASCWRFAALLGAAEMLAFFGLNVFPDVFAWKGYNLLYKIVPGTALFIFALYKRDALGLVAEKGAEGGLHKTCSCAACRQPDVPRPLPSSPAASAAEKKGPDKNNVLERYT
jgi:hypothetical protein